MPRSSVPRAADYRAILTLTHECRDHGDHAAGWRTHWMAGLARLIDADIGLGGELSGLATGRQFSHGTVAWGLGNGFDPAGLSNAIALLRADPSYSVAFRAYGERPGVGAALGIADMLDPDAWDHSTEYQQVIRVLGAGDPLYCLAPVPGLGGVASGEVFCRSAGRPAFTRRQKAVLSEANVLIRPMIGGLLARFADPSPAALPPRVREVLRCFLEGDSDKQVMARLGLSRHTVNQYAKLIHRHFGVSSRAELLARWVRRGWPVGGWAASG